MGFTGRKYYVNENYFDVWSANMAYILGFLMADGHVSKYSLVFGINPKDRCILEFIQSEIGSNQPLIESKHYNKKYDKYYDKLTLSLNSKNLCDSIRSKFKILSDKTATENICFDLPYEFQYDYIRGFFDGDGYVGVWNGKLRSAIYCKSKIILEQMQILCNNIGHIYTNIASDVSGLLMAKQDSIIFKNLIYNTKDSFKLDRKFNIFEKHKDLKFNPWNEEEIDVLINYSPNWDFISNIIGRTEKACFAKATELGLRNKTRKNSHFKDWQTQYIIDNFDPYNSVDSTKAIANFLNFPYNVLKAKITQMKIRVKRYKVWTLEDTQFLIDNMYKYTHIELSKILKCSTWMINNKLKEARKLINVN